jgi:hypothetical protein
MGALAVIWAKNSAFAMMWLLIIGVSVHDAYLVFVNRFCISSFELNPLGQALLHWNGDDVWMLLATKFIGTVCAASILLMLYWIRPRRGWIVCAVTAILQTALLLFLYLA